MKKVLFIMCLLIGVLVLTDASAQSRRERKRAEKAAKFNKVEIPLSGAQYQSDKNYYRATQSGESINMPMAKKLALQNARQELASIIKADLSQVIENYTKSQTIGSDANYENQYQELAYTVVEQQLVGAVIKGEQMYKNGNGKIQYYICLELNKAEMKERVAEAISKDEQLKLEFDLNRFRSVYDEQMQKYKEEQQPAN